MANAYVPRRSGSKLSLGAPAPLAAFCENKKAARCCAVAALLACLSSLLAFFSLVVEIQDRWVQLAPSGSPPSARSHHAVAWSDTADGLYVFGGTDPDGVHFNDLFLYERQANLWVQLTPSGSPPAARSDHTAAYSDAADGLYVFGGRDGGSGERAVYFNDLYMYERQANLWVQLAPSGSPPAARSYHTAAYSDAADGLYVFGGTNGKGLYFSDLYKYERQANLWVQLTPSGSPPAARSEHAAAWCNAANALYVFGGRDGGGFRFDDFYKYEDEADRWVELTPTGFAPSASWRHSVGWSHGEDALYSFGGQDDRFPFISMHKYMRQGDRWVLLQPLGSPPSVRWGHAVAWSDAAEGLYVFGGRDDVGFYFTDLWKYERQAFALAFTAIGITIGLGFCLLGIGRCCCRKWLTWARIRLCAGFTLGFGALSCAVVGVVAYSTFIQGLQLAAPQVLRWALFAAGVLLPWTGFWFWGLRRDRSKETTRAFVIHYLVAPILLVYFAWRLFGFSYDPGMTAAIVGSLSLPPLPWSLYFLWQRHAKLLQIQVPCSVLPTVQ